ncbi:MAG TPA: PLP-dependent aminotransferase family protein, partial [Desulfuromonadales bacterium]|nr:PLP-dependent aminotransferase family protein [Desulfuromonadales bacterium]
MKMIVGKDHGKLPLYEEVAARIASLVEEGIFRPGEKVPSIRGLSQQQGVSLNTVKQAYAFLEDRRLIEARPQSGYFVCARLPELPVEPPITRREISPTEVSLGDLSRMILRDAMRPELLQLGVSLPDPESLPIERLSRMMHSEIRRRPAQSIEYAIPPGNERLRTQIAKHMLLAGCVLKPDEIVITTGCMEAVFLALKTLCRPGDTVVVESPTFFNFLQLIEALGLKALEIPTSPTEGMSLEALGYALEHNEVKACLVVTNFNNPLGCVMTSARKQEMVRLLERHGVPLIEDDIHGDLAHTDERPGVARSFSRSGNVLLCSSFSKTVAPGYRVGWIAPGRYQQEIEALKMAVTVASASPTQMAVAEFLANGGYERHLRKIRRTYAQKMAKMGEAIGRYFPAGTKVSRPRGGFCLWVEMPEGVDSQRLYGEALAEGITIAPGTLFSASGKFRNCVRLNAAYWSARVEGA